VFTQTVSSNQGDTVWEQTEEHCKWKRQERKMGDDQMGREGGKMGNDQRWEIEWVEPILM